MISIRYSREAVRMEISGHAEYAPEGQDIVCAGISALFGALALHPLTVSAGTGGWQIVTVAACTADVMRPYFEMILTAMEDIAAQYPEHVRVHVDS